MSNTVSENDTQLLNEVRLWLASSRLFYLAYGVKKHLGPVWFVINTLLASLAPDGTVVFGGLLKSMPRDAQRRSSKNHDLSACLEHLRELKHIQTFESQKPTGLAGRSSFPVATVIEVHEKLQRATCRFARNFLRTFYGTEVAAAHSERYLAIAAQIYEFSSTTFIKHWKDLLRSLVMSSRVSSKDVFYNEMIGSSEYFVLLMSLWEMKMFGDDEEGYAVDSLRALHLFTRHVGEDTLRGCVERLVTHNILEQIPSEDEESHYRLSDGHKLSFEAFGKHLKAFREELRATIDAKVARTEQIKQPA